MGLCVPNALTFSWGRCASFGTFFGQPSTLQAAHTLECGDVPCVQVSSDESERLIKMEETLHQRVIGQEEAVVAISRAIRRARVGLKNPNRPIASFIFSGQQHPLCERHCSVICPGPGLHFNSWSRSEMDRTECSKKCHDRH